jgi:hypothetical protein
VIGIGREVRIIPVKMPGQFGEVECEPVVKMATGGDGVHRGVYLMYSIGRLDAICLRSALVLQRSEKADSQNISLHQKKVVKLGMIHIVQIAVGSEDPSHGVVDIASGTMPILDLDAMDTPYLAPFPNEGVGAVSGGVVMNIREKTGVRE